MSSTQKLIFSVVGSVLAHVLLAMALMAFWMLPSSGVNDETDAAAEPAEIVLMLEDVLSDSLMAEREKSFIRSDADAETSQAPDGAQFESDRNTEAETKNAPIPESDPLDGMPTIEGLADAPGLELRDRKFHQGEEIELPPPGNTGATSSSAPASERDNSETLEVADGGAAEDSISDTDGEGDDTQKSVRPESKAEELVESEPRPPGSAAVDSGRPDFSDPLLADAEMRATDAERSSIVDSSLESIERAANGAGKPSGQQPDSAGAEDSGDSLPEKAAGGTVGPMTETADAAAAAMPAAAVGGTPSNSTGESPAFVPETRANQVSGTLSNIGSKAAVAAEKTELGSYKQKVVTAIEKSWHQFRLSNLDDITAGNLRLRFRIDSHGEVHNLKILRKEANVGLTEFTLESILAADIPAMPRGVADGLGSGGLVMTYTVLVAY